MIRNNDKGNQSLKQLKTKEAAEKEAVLKQLCEDIACERFGKDTILKWSLEHKGLWYMPVVNEDGTIEKLGILKPIDRHILSLASTKIEDEGLYTFLGCCMEECWIDGDREILNDDEYFIPAAQKFNKIMEGKKVAFVKR